MDIRKYLILLNDKDKTSDIEHVELVNDVLQVRFLGNSRIYSYKKFVFLDNPKIPSNTHKICLYNVNEIIYFGEYCKIFFNNGSVELKKIKDLQLKQNDMDIFLYCKDIAKIVGIKNDDEKSILFNIYSKINQIPKESVLYPFLYPTTTMQSKEHKFFIFPFGLNVSQLSAIKNAMNTQISIIEGPPSTGKTQSILNIIANILYLGKNVAVVSNNNAATDNVFDKLSKYGLQGLCAKLGRRENIEEFINNQSQKNPTFYKDSNPYQKQNYKEDKVINLSMKAQEIFDLQNTIAIQESMLNELELEFSYFKMQENFQTPPPFIQTLLNIDSQTLLNYKIQLEESNNNISRFLLILKLCFIKGIGNWKFYKTETNDIAKAYEYAYYIKSIDNIKQQLHTNMQTLESLQSNNVLENLKLYSLKILNETLCKRYSKNETRTIFDKTLYLNPKEFCEEYPIIFSTTHSIKNCFKNDFLFDYLIIDEASQVDLTTGVLALSCAKNVVIVGDTKQLPNVVDSKYADSINKLSLQYKITQNYDFLQHSLLSSVVATLPNLQKVLLKEHYRCHPKIINFCNKKFYNNELVVMTKDNNEKDILKVYKSTEGNHARGKYNQREISIIANEILPTISSNDIGIITPYNQQKEHLKKQIDKHIEVDTVHKYQGREKEVIIIATTDNYINDFIDDSKMLNVAITRAKKQIIIVASNAIANSKSNIGDFIKYIQYTTKDNAIIESKVKSIFDFLYRANANARKAYLKNKKKISQYDSENIAYHKIKEILQRYSGLDIIPHVPIARIIKMSDILNQEEKNYAINPWTHFDFVIYKTIDKSLLLAIEIDGFAFHKRTKQKKRDCLKIAFVKNIKSPYCVLIQYTIQRKLLSPKSYKSL